jgi:hypothetical protein
MVFLFSHQDNLLHLVHQTEDYNALHIKTLNFVWVQLYIVGIQGGAADKILVQETSNLDNISKLVKQKFNLVGISRGEIYLYALQDKKLSMVLDPGDAYNSDLHGGGSNDCPIIANTSKLLRRNSALHFFPCSMSDSLLSETT